MKFIDLYHGNYKRLMVLPIVLYVVFIIAAFVYPGINLGIDFSGGTALSFKTDKAIDSGELEQLLKQKFQLTDLKIESVSSPVGYGVIINYVENAPIATAEKELNLARSLIDSKPDEAVAHINTALAAISKFATPSQTPSNPRDLLSEAELTLANAKDSFFSQVRQILRDSFGVQGDIAFEVKEIGPALGSAFWSTALQVGLLSLIFIVIVVLFFFRELIPSAAIVAAGIFDVLTALALMAVFNINLSLSTIPALLMLFGYSIDTDVMLTARLLKRKEGTPAERTAGAMGTGLTMIFATMAALTSMLVFSYLYQISVIFDIAAVIFFGLMGDIISTWFMNAPVLLWYTERKAARVSKR